MADMKLTITPSILIKLPTKLHTGIQYIGVTGDKDLNGLLWQDECELIISTPFLAPASLTDAERRRIIHRPPPEEEDALCRQACGLSMTELVAKAIAIPNNDNGSGAKSLMLTYKEAHLLIAGVVPEQPGYLLSERARLSEADRGLTHRAAAAALTEELKVARETALAVQQQWLTAQTEASKSLNDDDVRNILFAMRVPWQERIIQSTSIYDSPVSGLVQTGREEIGPLKVDIKHIAPTLSARLVQCDLLGNAKRWPYRHTSELTMLHQAARHSRDNQGQPDGIWPPPARRM
ncbi:conserved hypothetical protein [Talaromyces stipitatus ATCC 10500]|uniref:Uncharacterized protein n=1 Tax=Talaromyces stipitatus (strain ATCC 10500 / CBS 375.48 / QM 6759 / NRRL 1006) TaxID=441959 RepID=B8MG09_TALSN|nr:uncharacterized protein TSTA_009940 [Talaromyces stipitatus ATCC 10500]EED15876.1 conserved hypothetical protein [Talaromyces stipitatus ATCC 10500]